MYINSPVVIHVSCPDKVSLRLTRSIILNSTLLDELESEVLAQLCAKMTYEIMEERTTGNLSTFLPPFN
jgi:hypothetical protein